MQKSENKDDTELSLRRLQIVGQVYNVIKDLKSPDDRVKNALHCVLENEPKIFQDATKFVLSKSTVMSARLRDEGSNLCHSSSSSRDDIQDSFEILTKSIAYAPPESLQLSLAHSSRSEVLFKAHFMEDCLADINRSLELNCPDDIKAGLYLKKANCYRALNPLDHSPIQEALDELQKWLDVLDNENSRGLVEMAKKFTKIYKINCLKLNFQEVTPKLDNENPDIPGLSEAITIDYSKKYGIHVKATRNIKVGEILGLQKPYASVISPELRYFFCWHCHKQTYSSIPCNSCSFVIFCSQKCLEKSHQEYHDIECDILQYLFAFGITSSLPSLRLIILALKEAGNSLHTLINNFGNMNISTDEENMEIIDNTIQSGKRTSVYCLAHQRLSGDIREARIFIDSITVAYYLSQKTQLIGKKFDEDLSVLGKDKDFIFLVEFVEKNHWIVSNNSFNIMIQQNNRVSVLSRVLIPEFSFFNHSCVPMVERSYHLDNQVAIRALRPIEKDEQIFFCYVSNYVVQKFEDRQAALKKYNFDCDCKACTVENWGSIRETGSRATSRNFYCIFMLQRQLREIDEELVKIKRKVDAGFRASNKMPDLSKTYRALLKIIELSFECLDENSYEIVKAKKLLSDVIFLSQNRFVSLK